MSPIKNLIADAKQRMHALGGDRAPRARHHAHRPRLGGHARRHPVDYYGTPTPLNQVGNLSIPDPTLITSSPGTRRCCRPSRRRSAPPTST